MTAATPTPILDRLFIGAFPGGISYADKGRKAHGDFAQLAFLPYRTLELQFAPDCPSLFRAAIEAHAAGLQARRGQHLTVSTCGQTVLLGATPA